MRLYLYTQLVLSVLSIAVKLIDLSAADYPRLAKLTRKQDAIAIAGCIGWLVWELNLLFG